MFAISFMFIYDYVLLFRSFQDVKSLSLQFSPLCAFSKIFPTVRFLLEIFPTLFSLFILWSYSFRCIVREKNPSSIVFPHDKISSFFILVTSHPIQSHESPLHCYRRGVSFCWPEVEHLAKSFNFEKICFNANKIIIEP